MAQNSVDIGLTLPGAAQSLPVGRAGFREWWMVWVLFFTYVCALVDKGGIELLVNPIKADLGLSDVQMSLLLGFSFSLSYGLVGIPAGYLADIFNRKRLIAGAIVVWSGMSALCGFAGSFWLLFFGRTGLGTAEAILVPTANSLIRDGFPPESRGRAFSIFTMATVIGTTSGLLVTGKLISLGDSGFFHNWPILGHFHTWQIVLALPGFCTLPLALVMQTIPEPVRRASAALKSQMPSWAEGWAYIREHAWVYVPWFAGLMISGWATVGYLSWLPTALIRGWGVPAAEIAGITGTIGLTCGLTGLLIGAALMDFLYKRGVSDAPLRILIVGHIVGLFCYSIIPHVANPHVIFGLWGFARLIGGANAPAMALTISSITPSRLFGRLTAFMFLSASLLASSGSTSIALVAKWFFPGPLGIIPAMQAFYIPVEIVGIGLFILAAARVRRYHRLYVGGAG